VRATTFSRDGTWQTPKQKKPPTVGAPTCTNLMSLAIGQESSAFQEKNSQMRFEQSARTLKMSRQSLASLARPQLLRPTSPIAVIESGPLFSLNINFRGLNRNFRFLAAFLALPVTPRSPNPPKSHRFQAVAAPLSSAAAFPFNL
jgi:hypothetical protein